MKIIVFYSAVFCCVKSVSLGNDFPKEKTNTSEIIGIGGRVYLGGHHPICPNFINPQTDVELPALNGSLKKISKPCRLFYFIQSIGIMYTLF